MRNEIVPPKLAGSNVLHVLPGRAELLSDAMSVQKHAGRAERHALVSVYEWMVLRDAVA
jgi:hypothetical protein